MFYSKLGLSGSVVKELVSRLSHVDEETCRLFCDNVVTCMRLLCRFKVIVQLQHGLSKTIDLRKDL